MSQLAIDELHDRVRGIADDPERWQPHVRHEADGRVFVEIERDDDASVWLICWTQGHDTGFHDHAGSSGAVVVIAGEVEEQRLRVGARTLSARVRAGETFDFDGAAIHRVRHVGNEPTVTIHAYSPPLGAMGAYTVEPGGELRRHYVEKDTELKPLDTTEPAAAREALIG
jgi:quercetin dioxygenase-like cupin family protein